MSGDPGAVIAAQRLRREREMVAHLRDQGALAAPRALSLAPRGLLGRSALRTLLRHKSVLQTGDDTYWLDEAAYAAMRNRRRWRVAMSIAFVAIVATAFAVLR